MDIKEEQKKIMKSELLEEAFSWAKVIIFAVVFALVVNNYVIVNASVPTGSMVDTINEKDRVVAFRLAYKFSAKPERYDIVVFRYPVDESGKTLFVKRIIGMPGETVEIRRDGKVYINGSDTPLRDDFISSEIVSGYGEYRVPEGHYFMMGDNRFNSLDSRAWAAEWAKTHDVGEGFDYKNDIVNFVAEDKILGKVIFKYFPGIEMLYNK
ncbi:MAG: signal peptidase I [Clostridiales bacterium]|jgi:signal peptidase I|nr:signal peptidase I [Clostridiales bacterium]